MAKPPVRAETATNAVAATEGDGRASFRARLRRRFKAPRQLALTRGGKFFLLLTLAVGFGAINTGNNLLFLLTGMMLSVIIASGILSEAVIRHLRVRRRLPRRIIAGQPAPGTYRVVNQGWWPALSVETSECNPRVLAGPLKGQRIGPKRIAWWKFWRQQTDDELRPLAPAYFLRAAANEEMALTAHYVLPQRGEYELPGLQLITRFPFGFFEKSRQFDIEAPITVLPDALPASKWLGLLDSRWGETAKNRRGRGEEFFGLRDYRAGEDRRGIHWKSTARRGKPIVRETEARERRALAIIFDNRAPQDNPPRSVKARFELGIRHLAGFLMALESRGYRTQLLSCDDHLIPAAGGGIEPLLRHLAVIELRSPSTPPPGLDVDSEDLAETRIRIGFDKIAATNSADELWLSLDELVDSSGGEEP